MRKKNTLSKHTQTVTIINKPEKGVGGWCSQVTVTMVTPVLRLVLQGLGFLD